MHGPSVNQNYGKRPSKGDPLNSSVFSHTDYSIQAKGALLALFLAVIGMLVGIVVNGQFNGDFIQFYVEGAVALRHNAGLLYDIPAQTAFAHKLVPESSDWLLVPTAPPQISVLFSTFAKMTYLHAMLVWGLITYAGYVLCCYLLWRACPNLHQHLAKVAFAAVAFPGLAILVLVGQTTIIALAAFTWAFHCLRSNRLFTAGLAIGLLTYKPQLGLVAAGIFLLTRAWRIVAGALVTGLAQYALACWWYRKLIVLDFLSALYRLQHLNTGVYEPREYLMHSLRPFWRMLLPSSALAFPLYLITAIIVFVCCLRIWKSASPLALRFSAFLLATVLVDPHLYIYDLVVLAPALMLLVDWWLGLQAEHTRVFRALLYLTYSSPLLVRIVQTNWAAPIVALFSIAASAALFGFLYLQSTGEHVRVCCIPQVLPGTDPKHAPSLTHGAGV
jgi:arabinofuranan 3-O-arabinosyltransferase